MEKFSSSFQGGNRHCSHFFAELILLANFLRLISISRSGSDRFLLGAFSSSSQLLAVLLCFTWFYLVFTQF